MNLKSVLSVVSDEEGATPLTFCRAVRTGPPMLIAPVNSTHYEHAPSQWATMGPLDNQPDRPPLWTLKPHIGRQKDGVDVIGWREGKTACWPMALMGPKGTEGNWLWPPMPYRCTLCSTMMLFACLKSSSRTDSDIDCHPHNSCHSSLICQQEAN